MKRYKLIFLFWFLPKLVFAEQSYIIFVVDGSGSMDGTSMLEAKNAMIKTAKSLLPNGSKISIVVPKDKCNAGLRVNTKFYTDIDDIIQAVKKIKATGNDNIPEGFEHAQRIMVDNGYPGHIFMFGDCDGLEKCNTGIESIANKYKKQNMLTPFSYMQVSGCDGDEKKAWNKTLSRIGAKTGSASTFDYKSIIKKKMNSVKAIKQYFKNPKFINMNGSTNNGKNFRTTPWRCIESDGLFWLTIKKKEQKFDFLMTEPKNSNAYQKEKDNVLTNEFIALLNKENTCGQTSWRLANGFELSRLTQIGTNKRIRLFPYIRIWPYISSEGGDYSGYRKGVDFTNGKTYNYREDRPYAAMFVSGDIEKNLFEVPKEFMSRYEVINLNVKSKTMPKPESNPLVMHAPKNVEDTEPDNIYFREVSGVEKNTIFESNEVTIKGINIAINISIDNGEYNINGSGWTKNPSKINVNDKIIIRHKTANFNNQKVVSKLKLGKKEYKFITITRKSNETFTNDTIW